MTSNYFPLLLVLAILLANVAPGAQVLTVDPDGKSIIVSQRSSGLWRPNEFICVLHDLKEVACGNVTETNADSATVALRAGASPFAIGDFVEAGTVVKVGLPPAAGSPVVLPENVHLLHLYDRRLGAVVEAGPNYLFPGAQFQYALDRRTCLGVTVGYWAASPSQAQLTGYGGLIHLSFYQQRCFQGIWLGFDFGGYSLMASAGGIQETVNTLAGGATAGWDIRLGDRLSLRFAGGARFLSHPQAATISYDIQPWLFYFNGSAGWQF